ncbi:hypothetical protein Francci3_0027 [Frankia casuarinae]|nr:hypothetical protein Francci3_0027 [Frankia casuarinae]
MVAPGRPRTRGDLPLDVHHKRLHAESSPHARGSSEHPSAPARLRPVVPARAGIFLRVKKAARNRIRRPRTRGDLPRGMRSAGTCQWSSPHARGSSLRWTPTTRRGSVVPARAGIFLCCHIWWVETARRPRTRGDLPRSDRPAGAPTASSPHARGSSAHGVATPHRPAVVPARAGIFRTRLRRSETRSCRPRTRGDLPPGPARPRGRDESSPHARGSSLPIDPQLGILDVVPARAGIFLAQTWADDQRNRRPRTRGDLPSSLIPPPTSRRSSPHARGSSPEVFEKVEASRVVPARAGIFLAGPSGAATPGRSSPHARGSSPVVADRAQLRGVVPARAGIFPVPVPGRSARACRPRTRGDLPLAIQKVAGSRGSSPHARGSSCAAMRHERLVVVVPARAGIFPYTMDDVNAMAGRPRTRGDLPSGEESRAQSHSSSPHARGSSPQMRWESLPSRVVPARAGIFLEMDADHTARIGRPRTRGDLPPHPCFRGDPTMSSPHARGSSHPGRSRP